MDKYKINIIYGDNNLEDIIIKILIKEISGIKNMMSLFTVNLSSEKDGK